jgi:hypothetical protein
VLRIALAAGILSLASTAAFAQTCFPPASIMPQGRSCSTLQLGVATSTCNLQLFTTGMATPVAASLLMLGIQPIGGIVLPSPSFLQRCFLDFDPPVTFGFPFSGTSIPLPTAPVPVGTVIYIAALLQHPGSTGVFWSTTNNVVLSW